MRRAATALVLFSAVTSATGAWAKSPDPDAGKYVAPMNDEEVSQRIEFLSEALRTEGRQTRAWEAGWSLVYVGGFGYAAYDVGRSDNIHDRARYASGVIGMTKTSVATMRLILAPRSSSLGSHPLDGQPMETPEDRLRQLVRAELLLKRNAGEARYRMSPIPHILSALLNLAGGGIIWACGDFWKGVESAGIGIAAGELQIWTQPWKANKDEREYRERFGGYVGSSVLPPEKPRVKVSASVSGLRVTF